MLQNLEEGLKLSGEVNAAIRAGQGIGAKLGRLEYLSSTRCWQWSDGSLTSQFLAVETAAA